MRNPQRPGQPGACFLFGCLLAGGLFMAFVATRNFAGVERVLAEPAPKAAAAIATLSRPVARDLLRYQVSELNRFYFESWERAQLLLSVVLLYLFFRRGLARDVLTSVAAAMILLVVLVQRFFLTPQIVELGRAMDFNAAAETVRATFWRFHGIYSGTELFKWTLCVYGAARVMRRPAV